jgi:hypothetical protein
LDNYSAKPDGAREGSGPTDVSTSEGGVTLMEAALLYAGNDVPVFPLWNPTENGGCSCPKGLDCSRPAKHPVGPLVPHGLHDATTDPDQIREWWGQYPEANIGMPTGKWTGVVVLDVDPEKGGFESFLALVRRYGILPKSRVVHTGHLHAQLRGQTGPWFGRPRGRRLRTSSAERARQEQDLYMAGALGWRVASTRAVLWRRCQRGCGRR